jgi:uncharacterized protein (TIGR00290 family)
MTPAPVILAWSGGKDSALALQALRADPQFDPVGLLTTVTSDYDRISMHGVRRTLLIEQAAAVGLPLVEATIPAGASNEAYEAAMTVALDDVRVRFPVVRHVAFGDLYLTDVRAYRERQLMGSGFDPLFPLWGLDTRALAERFIDELFDAVIVCADTQQIAASFSGRRYDRELLRELPAHADPCGENGEFHTFVADGPVFRSRVGYTIGDVVLRDGRFAYCDLHLVNGASAAHA